MITAFIRTLLLYLLIISSLRVMGKRQIGELEPVDLVLAMMLSDLAAVPMQDFGIPLLAGFIPILTLISLSLLLSQLSLHSLRFREFICGKPAFLIRNGVLLQDEMRKNRYTVDELLEELRQQGYTSVSEVKYAVLENSGQLSVLPWARCQPPTAEQLGITPSQETTMPVILIDDGRILEKNLKACGRNEAWLHQTLKRQNMASPSEVFLLTVDEQGTVLCIKKEAAP